MGLLLIFLYCKEPKSVILIQFFCTWGYSFRIQRGGTVYKTLVPDIEGLSHIQQCIVLWFFCSVPQKLVWNFTGIYSRASENYSLAKKSAIHISSRWKKPTTTRKIKVKILKKGLEVADHMGKRHNFQVPRILWKWSKSI